MYLGATENVALQQLENDGQFFTELSEENPPVIDLGLPPIRMTIPIYSKKNLKLGILATAGVVAIGFLGVGAFLGRKLL